jgi:signal transduction histidine kinase
MTLDAFSQVRGDYPDAPWPQFETAMTVLRQVLAQTRRFMSGMRPHMLDELGVVAAVDHLICEQRMAGEARIEFECSVTFGRLAPPLETAIFRIVQEGLTNAQRHSQSDRILVELRQDDNRLDILVRDWGVGFDPAGAPQDRFGLEGIRERAAAMEGTAAIESKPGQGARIHVNLPLVPRDDPPSPTDANDTSLRE